ncbi:MAG: hypothetical protein IJF18_02085 [Oscillospiraceae bacterium]|nr:hypothetical protein [Oscillospiraceae bacterium]MBQ2823348.1 hypothetical protein [Oscillospiraceae bacterium]
MMKINWKQKLSSRKFWAAVAGFVVSVMIIFDADATSQERITGAITAAGTLATYILAEGSTDKAAIENKDE